MMHDLQTPTGMKDLLPIDHEYFTFIKKVVRHHARQAGMRRITPPTVEYTEVFDRGIGDGTDVVQKEMYTFEDRGGKSLTLRPELTAGIARAYMEHGMKDWPQPVELYAIESNFRYDRPQKGRFREFYQFDFEVIGEDDPLLDAQLIHLCYQIYQQLGLGNVLTLQLNSLGGGDDRAAYLDELYNYYSTKERALCDTCTKRLPKNTLRLLDCKEEDCQILADLAPKITDFLSPENKEHYEKVKEYLHILEVPYTENHKLVRGLDYYNRTVFEFYGTAEGAQSSLGGGGRYDYLIETLGGPHTPAVGFASGIERVMELMKEQGIVPPCKDRAHVFLIQLGEEAKKEMLKLLIELRRRGVKTVGALGNKSMKSQLRLADRFEVEYALIMGQIEVRDRAVILRNMKDGTQQTVPLQDAIDTVIQWVGEDNLDAKDFSNMIQQEKPTE